MNRTNRLRQKMNEQSLDAFVVTSPTNRRYLSGFTGSSGALVVTPERQFLVTDFRYMEQGRSQAPDWTLHQHKGELSNSLADLLNDLGPARVGFEADHMTVATYTELRGEMPHDTVWVSTQGLIRGLRAIKEPHEVAKIGEAQRIADQAAEALPALIQPGRTEREVAWALEQLLRELGADGPSFDIIVASGTNSALPHHRPSERAIQANEVVLVDFGALVAGYHSDMTRTWFTGEPTDRYRQIYELVHEALQNSQRALHVGMSQREADEQVRALFDEHEYGECFGHGLGHGVGLDVHEEPVLSFRASEEASLPAQSVVTVEPGIYLPEWGGIRLENLVYLTEDGVEVLSQTPFGVDLWRESQ